MEEAITYKKAVLVILDPLTAVLGQSIDTSGDQDLREIFTLLSQLAQRTGCAILIVRHLNKGAFQQAYTAVRITLCRMHEAREIMRPSRGKYQALPQRITSHIAETNDTSVTSVTNVASVTTETSDTSITTAPNPKALEPEINAT